METDKKTFSKNFLKAVLWVVFSFQAASELCAQSLRYDATPPALLAFSPAAPFSVASIPVDSAELRTDTLVLKKRFWRASAELMLAQVIPWAYNYYVRDAEFAHISWESIGHNLKFSSWEWDDNSFTTNQFAHPYHGSMYYSAFRTNGYNFWQSAPAAFAGSFIWETCGETHPPAQNDFINTSLGGISIGEMTFRFSNLIVNNRQHGFSRQVQEVLAFIVNPMNGFNRILDGRWGRYMANPADRVPGFLNGNLDVGWRRYTEQLEDLAEHGYNEFYVRAGIQYGNPFEDYEKPFSNFTLVGELGASDSATLNNVQITGGLFGNMLKQEETVRHLLAVTANYDYIRNSFIQFGAQSFTLKLLSDHPYGEKTHVFTEAGVIGVALAAVPDDYLYYGEGRNYDYGPGAGLQLGLKVNLADRFWFLVNYKGVWFHTLNGNTSDFFLHTLISDFRLYVTPQVSLGLQAGLYSLEGNYADYDDTNHKYTFGRLFVGYKIGS